MTVAGTVVLIAGPTASGKSALAIAEARASGAIVVNADSMQVYEGLPILTAQPGEDDLAMVPHRLYGHIDPADLYSTGRWLRDVAALRGEVGRDHPLVFCGGTGLYFRALTQGLQDMPEIPEPVRARLRYRLSEEGASRLHRELRARDPETAMRLMPGDGQRIVRALEVLDASGKSITWWQSQATTPLLADAEIARRIVLMPDRARLHQRIETRFDAMIAQGAVDEARAFLARGLGDDLPAMKAIGLREIGDHLAGAISLDEAVTLAKAASRQYAKRQSTWFRNQCTDRWHFSNPDV